MAQNHAQQGEWPVDGVRTVLQRRLEMDHEDAEATAHTLQEIFQGRHVIEDTEVDSKQRSFLWSLLLEGLVTIETQHRKRPEDGRLWRYYYWHLVPPQRLRERDTAPKPEPTVYDRLPRHAWTRTPGDAHAAA